MQAAKSGMTDVCRLYLEHGAKVNASTVVGDVSHLFNPWICRNTVASLAILQTLKFTICQLPLRIHVSSFKFIVLIGRQY